MLYDICLFIKFFLCVFLKNITEVLTQNGTTLRRNRRHLLKTNEPFQKELPIDYDDIIIDDDYDDQGQKNCSSCVQSFSVF